MTGDDLRKARAKLGSLWMLGRPVHASELGRALRFGEKDPGQSIRHYEQSRGRAVPGPVAVSVELFLRGVLPPDGIPR